MNLRRYGWALVYVLAGLVLVLVLVGINQIGDLAKTIHEGQEQRVPLLSQTNRAAQAAVRGTHRIENCTTPGRRCYDRGQRQLASVTAGLTLGNQRAAAAAAACATGVHHVTYRSVYRCVKRTLAQPRPKR